MPGRKSTEKPNPATQTGEDKGKIKRPQQTDATMTEEDLARGSEPGTVAPSRGPVANL